MTDWHALFRAIDTSRPSSGLADAGASDTIDTIDTKPERGVEQGGIVNCVNCVTAPEGRRPSDKGKPAKAAKPAKAEWTANDWLAFYSERASIAEHYAGLSRPQAEARAFECCIAEWLSQTALDTSPEDDCVWCGAPDRPYRMVVPFGSASAGHAWLHPECWPAWHRHRREQAISALVVLGITPPKAGTAEPGR
jgi:hypothetical protein